MQRATAAVVSFIVVGAWVGAAHADRPDDRAMLFELGLNTRRFAAADPKDVAFRSSEQPDPALGGGSAVSTSFRFTGRTSYDTFLGIEAEAGALVGHDLSNLAGAYGVAGARRGIGNLRLAVELVSGRRWVRYHPESVDPSVWIVEPRVRADLWLGPRATLGGAVGATLSDRAVWMAGVYLGITSSAFGR